MDSRSSKPDTPPRDQSTHLGLSIRDCKPRALECEITFSQPLPEHHQQRLHLGAQISMPSFKPKLSTHTLSRFRFIYSGATRRRIDLSFRVLHYLRSQTLAGSKNMKIGASLLVILAAMAVTLFGCCSLALTDDGVALLEVKNSLNDSKNSLSNWIYSDETPCQWTGITCSPQDQRVISINLPYMQLAGMISPNISKLSRLQRLALHQNSLHGPIPPEIAQCSDLRAMYLRSNYLQGDIPPTIGNLSKLTILDLSSNSLQGVIPPTLEGLTHLKYLNLSVNSLSGEIPHVGAISNFGYMAFIGNSKLCGLQVNRPCKQNSLGFPAVLPHPDHSDEAPSSAGHKKSSHYIKGLVIGAMSMLGFSMLLLVGFLFIWLRTKKERAVKSYTEVKKQQVHQEPRAKLITFHGDLPYTSCELVEKIESLDEEDIVGAGGYGTVYRMVMNDSATFAVKKIDRSREGSDQVFERELEILGSVKHMNLVNLRGYCRLPTARLLIYDFLAKGSLDYFLHDSLSEDCLLNWNDRLRIAIGSARGLAYLHHDCYPTIVHRDIKSSNILLDENLMPRVSDFGLAKLLVDGDAHVTTVVAGTFGYLAPEYLQSGRATEMSDVYSFGVLLLELVTGKRPTDPTFVKRGLNVVGWMNTLLRDNRLEDIVDKKCPDAEVEMLEVVVEIATRCTDANPNERPSMQEVVEFLEQETMMSPYTSEFYESQSDRC